MSAAELLEMLRHAAEHHGMHHVAALNEIRVLTRVGMSDEEFRDKTIAILDAVLQVDDEIEVRQAVAHDIDTAHAALVAAMAPTTRWEAQR